MQSRSQNRPFNNFVPECARFILQRQGQELPADIVAEVAIDEGLYKSSGRGRAGQIRALLGTLHSEVTRGQPNKSPSEQIFYRTEKKPHPRTGRMVFFFGLTEWRRGASSVNGRIAPQPPSELRVSLQLDPKLQLTVNVLLAADLVSNTADGVLWLAREGLTARAEYLGNIQKALNLLRNARDGVGLTEGSVVPPSEISAPAGEATVFPNPESVLPLGQSAPILPQSARASGVTVHGRRKAPRGKYAAPERETDSPELGEIRRFARAGDERAMEIIAHVDAWVDGQMCTFCKSEKHIRRTGFFSAAREIAKMANRAASRASHRQTARIPDDI